MSKQIVLAFFALVLSGCVTARPAAEKTVESRAQSSVLEPGKAARSSNEVPRKVARDLRSLNAKLYREPGREVPREFQGAVQKWMSRLSAGRGNRFAQSLSRGAVHKERVQAILVEHGVPPELYYLAMIESGFVASARSPAGAAGVWQFTRGTARKYGLRANSKQDERKDILRSTRAAAQYLKDLHDQFGCWYLSLAAYNAGDGRLRRAIRKSGSRDFWELAQKRALPRETIESVPRFLAAALLGEKA